ncbi:MAG: peptidylprolyl isomerase [Verrucomicrobiota bacterium]
MRYVFVFWCLLAAPLSISASILAQFRTSLGDMQVELYDESKPITVQNFIRYVREGYTNNMIVHRWHEGDIHVIQGGGYFVADRGTTNQRIKGIETTFPAITNEYGAGRLFSNTYGTIAMARVSGQTNSATSQWFINVTDNVGLDQVDGGFTVFGKVVGGTNVLEIFKQASTNSGVYKLFVDFFLPEVPVRSPDPDYGDLLFVDVSLLDVHVRPTTEGLSEISWQSVSNKVNRVEFTPQFPPVWTELFTTNGTGSLIQYVDPQPGATNRFYRVRVDY